VLWIACDTFKIHATTKSTLVYNTFSARNPPDISQLIVHIPHVIFDVYSHTGGLQCLHGEMLGEGTDKQSPEVVCTGHVVGHSDLFCLFSILQVEDTYK